MSEIKFPDQPLVMESRVVRFAANNIVRFLLDHGGVDLNKLATIGYLFTQAEWEQFYQLIGYSVSGYGDLEQVSSDTKDRCDAAASEFWDAAQAQPGGEDS